MDFKDILKNMSERIEKLKDQIKTEEATKNALIMPFIQALGYDVFNPMEVVPEYCADIGETASGIKKGEKVDYAIMKDGCPIILIECKWHGEKMEYHNDQLFRYFHTSKAKFGVLTNGIIYQFFTDLDEANKMDSTPFLEMDMLNLRDNIVEEVKKFQKSYFNIEQAFNSASELKYNSQIKKIFSKQIAEPDETFIKFFAGQVYPGRLTEKILSQFAPLVKKSLNQYITDQVTDRLQNALVKEEEVRKQSVVEQELPNVQEESKVVTTQEETEAFLLVKTILRSAVDSARLSYKDTQNYLAVLLDGNTRKTICRMWLNGQKKYISFIDDNKKDVKFEISKLDDIYHYGEMLVKSVKDFDVVV